MHVGFALALAGVASGPACHRIGRGAQYHGVPRVGIATQAGPLAAMVPSADIGLGRGGVRPVGATGPKRAESPELVRVQRPDLDAKSRRGVGYVVWQEELPPRGRAGVPVGLRLVVASPSHRDAGDGGSERPDGRSSSSSPGVPPHGFPSRGSQPRSDVHRSYAGCFTHPEESCKGDDGKAQAEPVEGGLDVPGHEAEGDQLGPHLGWSWRDSGGRGASCHEPVYGPHCGW